MSHNPAATSAVDSTGSTASSIVNDSTPLWQNVTRLERSESGGNTKFTCNFCKVTFTGSYFRVKAHLLQVSGHGIKSCNKITKEEVARLRKVQDDVEARAKAAVPRQVPRPSEGENTAPIPLGTRGGKKKAMTQLEKSWDVSARNQIEEEIARAFYTGCPSFNLAKNPHFIRSYTMLSNSGIQGFKPPSYNKIKTTLLDRERVHVDRLLEPLKSTWTRKGLSIVSDGWTDVQRRPLINFIAITDGGPMFLKAVNCQGEVKDKFFISSKIKEVIDEVGPQNVVQVITDNAPVCKAAGMLIEAEYPKIFWTPCVVHTLNLALKNICAAKNTEANSVVYDECSWISIIASDVFTIKNFINNHAMRLYMYQQSCDLKLLSAAETRFASVLIVLRRFCQVKRGLKELVIKEDWNAYEDDNIDKANFVREKVLDETEFWAKIEFILAFTEPIYEILRITDTDKPCLHLVYEMWDNMIDKVKAVIYHHEGKTENEESSFFNVVKTILTDRWAKSNTPLHCLAYSLNPRYYSPKWLEDHPGRMPPHMGTEISRLRNKYLRKLFPNDEERRSVLEEYARFSICGGGFDDPDSINDREVLEPINWWVVYGGVASNLQVLALKLLIQPSSSSCCERNWKTYSLIHDAKRNQMTPKRAEDLVFVHSNLRLLSRRSAEYLTGETMFWDVGGDAHEPFDGAEQLAVADLSLDEPEFQRVVFGEQVNED